MGSQLMAFPCSTCSHCGAHIDAAYEPGKSESHMWLNCSVDLCMGSCSEGHCSYHQGYTEGSSLDGWYFVDYVSLGDNPAVFAELGCHIDEKKLFYTQKVNGILGLAPN